jgi:hypothetical protein
MTPTLTNAQKYSSEFGFERGVLFEAIRKDGAGTIIGYFQGIDEKGRTYPRIDYQFSLPLISAVYHFRIENIKSIRLLSGRWSIWQFAPADAIGVSIDTPFGDVKFFIKGEQKQFDEYRREHWTFTSLDAPWWWLEA